MMLPVLTLSILPAWTQSPRAEVAAGSEALQNGQNSAAEASFRAALKSQPDSLPLLNNLALAIVRQQRFDEAIVIYKRMLEIAPGDKIAERNLGVAYFRAQHYRLALPLLEDFAKDSPSFQAFDLAGLNLFALGRYEQAAAMLNKASQLEPRDLGTLDMLGKAYLRAKNYAALNDVFKQLMAIAPESAEAHALMGVADDNLFKEDDALNEFRAALAANPLYPGAHTSMGIIYWRNDNLVGAETEFKLELAHYPNDPIANCTMGRIRQRQGRYGEAVTFLEAALSANPSYRDALLALGEAKLSLGQPDGALDPLRRTVALDENDSEGHYLLGSALVKLGRTAEGAREREVAGHLHAIQNEKNRRKSD